MTATTRSQLYTFYQSGDRPTQSNFQDLIDSALNIADTSGQFITSDVSCGGTFDVSGAFTVRNSAQTNLSGNLVVSGQATLGGLNISNLTINNLTVVSAFTGNSISISGAVSANAVSVVGAVSAATAGITGGLTAATLAVTTSGSPSLPAVKFLGSAGLSTDGTALVFSTNNAESARINGNGNLVVAGTNDAPFNGAGLAAGRIVVDIGNSAANNGLELSSGTTSFIPLIVGRQNSNTGTFVYFAYNTTNVGVITTDGSTTTYSTTSDARKKELLSSYDPNDLFDNIKVWNFNWKSSRKQDVGCVAQELIDVLPNAVTKGDDTAREENEAGFESWHISYPSLVPYLIAEIKALRQRVKSLEDK